MPLPCVPLPCLGPAAQQRSRKFSSGSGKCCLHQGARHVPLVPGFRGGWDRGARRGHRVPGSPWPPRPQGAHRPTWLLQGGQGCQSWARGPGPGASPACAGTWRLPRPRLQPRLGSARLLGGQVRLLALRASLRGPLWRCAAARPAGLRLGLDRTPSVPQTLPAGHHRPSVPCSTHPGAAGRAENESAWWHCGSRNGAALGAPGLPPPFVSQKSPSEAPGATPASRVRLAPLGCWGSWGVCLWASGGESECT